MSKVLLMIKEFGSVQKNSAIIKYAAVFILLTIFITGLAVTTYTENISRGLADNLIRLHVLANSDSAEDQALKRDVRDIVLSYMKDQLKASKDIEQTKYIINTNMQAIEKLASNEIARRGMDYEVRTMLGSFPFPTKVYGDVTLPAGNYQALRIIIGKGEGANWWCVLFPPLCFVDATHGTISDSVKQDLKSVLTEEEYKVITTASSDEDIPVKIKFKVVEFFQDSKIKFSGIISKIFK